MTREELVALQETCERVGSRPGAELKDGRYLHVWSFMYGQFRLVISRDKWGYEIDDPQM